MATALVTYTTRYRDGGDKFQRCAETKADQLRKRGINVRCIATETKEEFAQVIADDQGNLDQLHFFGHSGLYGIMFGTTKWPEQFSPYEWQNLTSPFADNASAYFHACRTARWFAPFIARTFNIATYGYTLYTTFSDKPAAFSWSRSVTGPLYMVSVPGKKSHGLPGSIAKYSGIASTRPMERFEANNTMVDDRYDEVADLYDDAYSDIKVRHDEWTWIQNRVPPQSRVCDLGCGNGALLRALEPNINYGIGLDESLPMLAHAKKRSGDVSSLSFAQITGPKLPLADASIDTIISMLSFRYLDWDPIIQEMVRVLSPQGRILIVDMVESPAHLKEYPTAIKDRMHVLLRRREQNQFHQSLQKLVTSSAWKKMLHYNPMRAEHEYRWYLSSRFPNGTFKTINVAAKSKIIAFDSGPIQAATLHPLTYP